MACQSGSHQERDETLKLGNLRRVSKRLLTEVWKVPGDRKKMMGRWGLPGVRAAGTRTAPKRTGSGRGFRTRDREAPQGGLPEGSNDLA